MRFFLTGLILFLLVFDCGAQTLSDTNTLKEIRVNGIRTIRGIGHLPSIKDGIIYEGMKNEVIVADSLDATSNKKCVNWEADKFVLKKLLDNPELIGETYISDFVENMLASNTGSFRQIDDTTTV